MSNVVAARAVAQVDVRATTLDAAAGSSKLFARSSPSLPVPGSRSMVGSIALPWSGPRPSRRLFDRARVIGRGLGIELTEGSTGGGSDGNFTAAIGIPTLDGLGVKGGGAHADDEHIQIDSLPERAALLAALLLNL